MPSTRLRPGLILLFCLALAAFAGCRRGTPVPAAMPTATPAPDAEITPGPPPTPVILVPATTGPGTGPTEPAPPPDWPAPAPLPGPFDDPPPGPAEEEAARALAAVRPPERDDVRLAQGFLGVGELPATPAPTEPPAPGTTATFDVLNTGNNTYSTVEAVLVGSGEHAHFWFDTSLPQPTAAELAPIAAAFDEIYAQSVAIFGPESNPGIDGDPRVHILHASPAALCTSAGACGLLGYFSSHDSLPRAVASRSNERDMFLMNASIFGQANYLGVLAHEFRHMIEDNYDRSDADWEVEGSASLAEELTGFPGNPRSRANLFLAQPDQQLSSWVDSGSTPYYGMGYLLNRYLYDRLGPDLYRAFAAHPADGLDAITAVAEEAGLPLTGHTLWEDWLVALAIHNLPGAPEIYRIGDGTLDTALATVVSAFPVEYATTVRQYAADYYRLEGEGDVTISFEGAQHVPLLGVPAASGSHFWIAARANYSQPSLSRAFDLRALDSATLTYEVYHDIETGYDFAYVAVSSDGGETWEGLVGQQMQGLAEEDNPSGKALTSRFYTGESDGWVQERIDLTPYAGREIILRFSYITDPILTYGGLAVDNVSIPELGFYDDVEEGADGWQAEGFSRVTATLPQQWHLQLITFPDGAPQVEKLPPSTADSGGVTLDLGAGGGRAILVVAASAPQTLQEASYRLSFTR